MKPIDKLVRDLGMITASIWIALILYTIISWIKHW